MRYDRIINSISLCFFALSLQFGGVKSLENGVARLPPMGWSAWAAFGCDKCKTLDQTDCLSENTIKNAADLLVAKGYAAAGYEYVVMDDCWQTETRDAQDELQPDPNIFPSGMTVLADYLHEKNLKLGIFSDLGDKSGGDFPGSYGHFEKDANTFARWKVDYVKMSAFGHMALKHAFLEEDYIHFGECLRKTNRPILYATSWPAFKRKADYRLITAHCNTWRFSGDAEPSWLHILGVMDAYAARQKILRIAHAGAWNDADLLMIGHPEVTLDQARAQMAVWSIMPSSLIFSYEIDRLSDHVEKILLNRKVIAVHQDPLGLSGYRALNRGYIDVWLRPISPIANGFHSFAIAVVNRNEKNTAEFEMTLDALGLVNPNGYYISDLFSTSELPREVPSTSSTPLRLTVNPAGVVMYKAEAVGGDRDTTEIAQRSFPVRYYGHKMVDDV